MSRSVFRGATGGREEGSTRGGGASCRCCPHTSHLHSPLHVPRALYRSIHLSNTSPPRCTTLWIYHDRRPTPRADGRRVASLTATASREAVAEDHLQEEMGTSSAKEAVADENTALNTKLGSTPTCEAVAHKLGADGETLSNSTVIVTGGSCGIGLQTAAALAKLGAVVVVASRDREKGLAGLEALRKAGHETARMHFLALDLGSTAAVRAFVDAFRSAAEDHRWPPLDRLVLNAGIMRFGAGKCRRVASCGTDIELTFHVNHLGHFLLTHLLMPELRLAAGNRGTPRRSTTGGRVVVVSSGSHYGPLATTAVEDRESVMAHVVRSSASTYGGLNAYGSSKLCNVLFAAGLAARESAAGTGVEACSLHPGAMVATQIATTSNIFVRGLMGGVGCFTKSLDQAAATTLPCSLVPRGVLRGQFWDCCR